jgi:hypothetical protein
MPFADAPLASAFVARWCVGAKVETAGGAFPVREDELAPRIGAGPHRAPYGRQDSLAALAAPAKENPGEGDHTGGKKQAIADGGISDRHILRTPSGDQQFQVL